MFCLLSLALLACGDKDTDGTSGPPDPDGDGYSVEVDCDETDAGVHPDAVETCDSLDEDCDGNVDEGLGKVYYADLDADGYGDPNNTTQACTQPEDHTTNSTDCDDTSSHTHPSAEEICDGADNDCDNLVDEDLGDELSIWFRDADGDGHGDAQDFLVGCEPDEGYVASDEDCDDSDDSVYPGAEEIPEDGIDQDCDGEDALNPVDFDRDGYDDTVDCDDRDPDVHPDAWEICDGIDNDCDSATDEPWFQSTFDDPIDPTQISLNGSAVQAWDGKDGFIQLTSASSEAGAAFFTALHPADEWVVTFYLEVRDGTGADGLAFAFLDETDPTIVGSNGGALGVEGFQGYVMEWDSYYNSEQGDPTSSDHCAFLAAEDFSVYWYSICNFRNLGELDVEIQFSLGSWRLIMGGTEVGSGTIDKFALDEVLMGFTASTGTAYDTHTIDDVTISCP